jgi:hypothetical protein
MLFFHGPAAEFPLHGGNHIPAEILSKIKRAVDRVLYGQQPALSKTTLF